MVKEETYMPRGRGRGGGKLTSYCGPHPPHTHKLFVSHWLKYSFIGVLPAHLTLPLRGELTEYGIRFMGVSLLVASGWSATTI